VIGIAMAKKDLDHVRNFYRQVVERETEKGEPVRLDVELRLYRKRRTVSQIRLLHSIINRIAEHQDVNPALIYAGVKKEFYPTYPEEWRGHVVKKETNDLSTIEMGKVIEHTFVEACEMGADIKDIWCLWEDWRGQRPKGDPLEGSYTDMADYRAMHPVCEACGVYLGESGGELAHIVPQGNGGSDEDWNRLRLCIPHHRGVIHQKSGLSGLIEIAPHLKWKINRALSRHNRTLEEVEGFLITREEKGKAEDAEVVKVADQLIAAPGGKEQEELEIF
jgi:hypothetical protein